MLKTLCKILGCAMILAGMIGFVQHDLLGMHLSGVHNIIHLLTGAVALYVGFAGSINAARTFSLAFGAIYALLGVLGFIAPEIVASVIQADSASSLTPDNAVHILLGAVFLIAGLVRAPHTAAGT